MELGTYAINDICMYMHVITRAQHIHKQMCVSALYIHAYIYIHIIYIYIHIYIYNFHISAHLKWRENLNEVDLHIYSRVRI